MRANRAMTTTAILLCQLLAIPTVAESRDSSRSSVCTIAVFPPVVDIWVVTEPSGNPGRIDASAYRSALVAAFEAELARRGFHVSRNAFTETLWEQADDPVRRAWADLKEAPSILSALLTDDRSESAAVLTRAVGVDALVVPQVSGSLLRGQARKKYKKTRFWEEFKFVVSFGYEGSTSMATPSEFGLDLHFAVYSTPDGDWLRQRKTGAYIGEVRFGNDSDLTQGNKIRKALKRWERPSADCRRPDDRP